MTTPILLIAHRNLFLFNCIVWPPVLYMWWKPGPGGSAGGPFFDREHIKQES